MKGTKTTIKKISVILSSRVKTVDRSFQFVLKFTVSPHYEYALKKINYILKFSFLKSNKLFPKTAN